MACCEKNQNRTLSLQFPRYHLVFFAIVEGFFLVSWLLLGSAASGQLLPPADALGAQSGASLSPSPISHNALNKNSDSYPPLSIQLRDPPEEVYLFGGRQSPSLTLKCDVKSTLPHLEIFWLHNDKLIEPASSQKTSSNNVNSKNDTNISTKNNFRRILKEDGTLYFPKIGGRKKQLQQQQLQDLQASLAGEYRCLARNAAGAVLSNPTRLRIASFDLISSTSTTTATTATTNSSTSTQQQNLSVPESQPAILHCNIHSVPAAHVQWERDNTELPQNERYVPLPTGALLITKTHSSDAGLYRCKATNYLLKKTKHSKIIELTVTSSSSQMEAAVGAPPSFLPLQLDYDILPNIITVHDDNYYSSVTTKDAEKTATDSIGKTNENAAATAAAVTKVPVLLGDEVNLYCAARGWPVPTVQWLNNSNHMVISNSTHLHIPNATLHHSGNYTCRAQNSLGKITRQFHVDVRQKPYFNVTPPTSIEYPSAKTVRLDCQALGVPKPEIEWLKNGERLNIGGRLKQLSGGGLVFSHTFTYDAGIYQCVATNAAGRAWVAAQLVLAAPYAPFPSPPEDVRCRRFDDASICLRWRAPRNVTAQAYSIYSFYKAKDGTEISGPDYVINSTSFLATGLNKSTNYSFYIRLYSNSASDQSQTVTCQTGVYGKRNLQIKMANETSVELTWAKISSDTPCDGGKEFYKVQWRRKSRILVSTAHTEELRYLISGLIPNVEYVFNVASTLHKNDNSPWLPYALPPSSSSSAAINRNGKNNGNAASAGSGNSSSEDNGSNFSSNAVESLVPPEHLEANATSATSVNLTWTDVNANTIYYTISLCRVITVTSPEDIAAQHIESKSGGGGGGEECEDTRLIRSEFSTTIVDKLQPNSEYEVRVRTHSSDSTSAYSPTVEFKTPSDVPSPVSELKYRLANETAACLKWRSPLHSNGHLTNYMILYTPDSNRPLEEWLVKTVSISQKAQLNCDHSNDHTSFSTWLLNLEPNKEYMVLVQAESNVGLGRPTVPIRMITDPNRVTTDNDQTIDSQGTLGNNQKIGIIMGVTIAFICIIICISSILVRKQCLKNRARARSRTTNAASNYYPAVAHYATEGTSCQVRLEDPCSAEIHEIEHLVSDDSSSHLPTITPTHLDTKGADGFPNGHINGSAKPLLNGHAMMNGGANVRITENPRYYALVCNGHVDNTPTRPTSTNHLHTTPRLSNNENNLNSITVVPAVVVHQMDEEMIEDSNSNLRPFKLTDLHRFFDGGKGRQPPSVQAKNPQKLQSKTKKSLLSLFNNRKSSSKRRKFRRDLDYPDDPEKEEETSVSLGRVRNAKNHQKIDDKKRGYHHQRTQLPSQRDFLDSAEIEPSSNSSSSDSDEPKNLQNSTQLTCLDLDNSRLNSPSNGSSTVGKNSGDSNTVNPVVVTNNRMSPILGPNG